MWVLPVDRSKIPRVPLPPGRYLLPWYLTADEVERFTYLLAGVLEGVTRQVVVPWAAIEALAHVPVPDADATALVIQGAEREPAPEEEEAIARIACRYAFIQWPVPRELGYGWQEQYVKPVLRAAISRELRDPAHPLAALNVQATPVLTAATLTPDPLELVDLLEAAVAHRLRHAQQGLSDKDYLSSLLTVAGQRLAVRLLPLPRNVLEPALEILFAGEDGLLDGPRARTGGEGLEKVGLARVSGGAVALGPLARAIREREVKSALLIGLPYEVRKQVAHAIAPAQNTAEAPEQVPPKKAPVGTLFTWVHLADIHYGLPDRAPLLDALRQDIAQMVSRERLLLDAILVTGDIAFSGRAEEYAGARTWLLSVCEAVGLAAERTFVVPGNHDVDRRVDEKPEVARLVTALRDGKEKLDEALRRNHELLAQRQGSYLAFAEALAPDRGSLFWVHRLKAGGGLGIRVVGLNTALISADDMDRGRLRLGVGPITAAFAKKRDAELVIVMSHHPVGRGWLANADDRGAFVWVRNYAHMHLCSHVHDTDSEETRAGAGEHVIRVAAGAMRGVRGETFSLGYSIGAIVAADDGSLTVRIWPRRWSPSGAFRHDADSTREGRAYAEHKLRLSLMHAAPAERPPGLPLPGLALFEGPGGLPITAVENFLGRDEEMSVLRDALAREEVLCVVGIGGIGKSALVRQFVAAEAPAMFPDGSLWIDAMSLDADAARAAERFGRRAERRATAAEAAAFLARVLHDKQVLVVIENADPTRATGLPMARGRSRTVLISRALTLHEALGVPAQPILLGRWTAEACVAYLRNFVPDVTDAADDDLRALADFVGRVPLAVSIVARQLIRPGMTAARLLDQLKRDSSLGTVDQAAAGAGRGLTAIYHAAYHTLTEPQQRVLRAFAACAPVTSLPWITGIAGMDEAAVADALTVLAERSLVQSANPAGRWRLPHGLWLFLRAQGGIEREEEVHMALAWKHVEQHADPADWEAMGAGMDEVLAAVDRLLRSGEAERAASLIDAAKAHLMQSARYGELMARYELLTARLPKFSEAQATALANLGACHHALGDTPKAIEYVQRALDIFEKLGNLNGQARSHGKLGSWHRNQGDLSRAIDHLQHALAIFENLDHLEGQARTLADLGLCYRDTGTILRAIDSFQRALALYEKLGDVGGQARALANLGDCYWNVGRFDEAIEHHRRSLAVFENLGQTDAQAALLLNLGLDYEAQGDTPRALDHVQRSLALLRELGLPDDHPAVRHNLAVLARLSRAAAS